MVAGKRVSQTFATKAEAEAFRQDMAQSIAVGSEISNESLGHVVESWLAHIKATKDSSTHAAYQYAVAPFAKLYPVSVLSVRTIHLQAILDTITGRTEQMAHDKIRQCMRRAVRFGMLTGNPSDELIRPQHERQAIEVFTPGEVAELLAASEHYRFHAAIRLALSVGLRGGEVWGLQWGDWNGTELSIQRQAAERSGIITIKPPKRNSLRTISLPDSVVEALETRQQQRLREGFAACDWIFPDSKGHPTRRSNFSARAWKRLLKSVDVRPRGFHHCRHTAASMLLNNGVPITAVSRTLGHKDPATTLSIYAHLMTSELTRHRNCFDEIVAVRG